jgi:mono/diheme cytochrome c family protein
MGAWIRASAVLLVLAACAAPPSDGNRLTYLATTDPYAPSRAFPKFTTPMWIGEPGVEAAFVFSIDDMRDPAHYEKFLRPLLERLKRIDGRAPVSIFTCRVDPADPLLANFLREGLSLEVHTVTHPCPLLAGGDLPKARREVHDCLDALAAIPGAAPLAYRMPCCDVLNTQSPRVFSEILRPPTAAGRFLRIDSSVHHLFTAADPELPREIALDEAGRDRFRKYTTGEVEILGSRGYRYANWIADSPYPYVIGRDLWEVPCLVPGDHQADFYKPLYGERLLEDWKAALDAVVAKRGIGALVFHPWGRCTPEQLVALVDHAVARHGSRIKFLTMAQVHDRITRHALAGRPLRADDGTDNGVRLLDIDNDGFMDVVSGRLTRIWDPAAGRWKESPFPADASRALFGVFRPDGAAGVAVPGEGLWHWDRERWRRDSETPPADTALLRDADGDGRCEFFLSDGRVVGRGISTRLPAPLSPATLFADVDGDGRDDVIFSDEERFGVWAWTPRPPGWNRAIVEGRHADGTVRFPRIGRGGAFAHSGRLWVINERTDTLPDHADSIAFADIPELALRARFQAVPPERPRVRPPSAIAGSADWSKGEEMFARIPVPPAPVLSPEEERRTFRVAPGYRVELVAAEPLVMDPVFLAFDADGRLWVVEYRGYMRDLEGRGEGDPICNVVVLEDLDEDGRMDKRTVFLDGLVMPRTIAFAGSGVLVAEPPHLWFCEDADGDLRADGKRRVGDYGHAGNPQHTANGLVRGIDNWLHSADWPFRHRMVGAELQVEPTIHRGQWGITQDDLGRLFYSYESSPLHGDLFPAAYGRADAVNVNVAAGAREVFPIRVTPGVTLGARELREDGRLRTYTIAAGPTIYRAHQFPPDAYGNAFVPEAAGHLIGRLRFEGDPALKAVRFYPPGQELLASTDERFRPVFSVVGPDGALTVADLYQGVIEHVIFMVPWLERQIRRRELERGLDNGRIWRIVHEGNPIDRRSPRLSAASPARLVELLSHPDGWWRDTAQRLLVDRRDASVVPALGEALRASKNPLGRLHALWTLEGIGALDAPAVRAAAADPDARVRAAAARLAPDLQTLEPLASDPAAQVRLHALLRAGSFEGASALKIGLLARDEGPLFRSAALVGLDGREAEFLRDLLGHEQWRDDAPHRRALIASLAHAVVASRAAKPVAALLEAAAAETPWRRGAILEGMTREPGRPILLEAEPPLLKALATSADEALRRRAYELKAIVTWPGGDQWWLAVADLKPLTEAQRARAAVGRERYQMLCAPCHQPDGAGMEGRAPPLAGSEWITESPERLARIVMQGLFGPIEVKGKTWDLHMPAMGAIADDEAVAGLLTYVRRAWGNAAEPVEPELIARVRKETDERILPWTARELAAFGTPAPKGEEPEPIKAAGGLLLLPARRAVVYGTEFRYHADLDIVGPWKEETDVALWTVEAPAAGRYEVHLTFAMTDESAGNGFAIETDGGRLTGTIPSTGGFDRFEERSFGTVALKAGVNRVLMRPAAPVKLELADLRAIRLVPARP